ncbi:MAG: hypothetical protein JNJ50_03700 [Acidobacteria bacterium]|nr:hypothetical protein [Acidobacteriota bacterium]
MSFLLRAVFLLLIFGFVVYVLKAIARLSFHLRGTVKDVKNLREQLSGRPAASAEMVRCASCGAFVAPREAVTISGRGAKQIFCSHDCLRAHAQRA